MKNFGMALVGASLVLLSGCGGGGDSSGSTQKNLSKDGALHSLYSTVRSELAKGEFESTTEYNNRIDNFVLSLNGYKATEVVRTRYDADLQELIVYRLTNAIFDGEKEANVQLDNRHARLTLDNVADLYQGEVVQRECSTSEGLCEKKYYRILSLDATEAERISKGFRVDYTITFSREQIESFKYDCLSANYTNCTRFLYGSAETYRVYNIVDGEVY